MTPRTLVSRFRGAKRLIALPLATALLAALIAGCGGGSSNSLSLVAYSTPQEAYSALIPAFTKTPAGKGISFNQSYGASGDQSRAVGAGLAADVVEFALEPDMQKLVDAGKVAAGWNKNAHKGFVTDSVVTFVVRKGNPKGIKGWDDLTKPGVEVITPNPFSSGGARWNVMAAYGSQITQGRSDAEGIAFLKALFTNVPVQDKSARDALQTFIGGKGDVLISYENEAITAQQKGQDVDYVTPDQTILIENPIAVTSNSKHPQQAKAFVDFLLGPEAQKIFASKGYRPVDASLVDAKQFPKPSGLFTIDDLGGWSKISSEFFDPDKGKFAAVEKDLGVSTAK
ncbi:MAG: sulfate/thiosulfate transport system substrate-binding protein [Solirubrobacterales bacterium]|jgi:sulfate transport system substrate-binding protein|nr:sulfate/thiosulfate transport system substrate-binding protein [Solirubrobacterales bacterium]